MKRKSIIIITFALALCVALIAILQLYSIPTIILLYILVSAVRWGLKNNGDGINN